ncbi:hypothetical protein MHY87_15825 [Microvirga sp. ACRRW]|nr:hypothetical protein [Microvirga sp. ACRRW]MCG7394373.1 hypothetical protein [Microvirga sp. ACRRW]
MNDEDGDRVLEVRPQSPVNDDLARVMDWVGLSAAIGMIAVAVFLAS